MGRRAPTLVAALASMTLVAATATAQTPHARRARGGVAVFVALRGVGDSSPVATERLLYNDPLAGFAVADPARVDARRRRVSVRTLAVLRARVRALGATVISYTPRSAMRTRWSAMESATLALVPLARRVAAARDPTLTTDALSALGDAFEHLRVERNRVNFYVPYEEARCGTMRNYDPLMQEVSEITEEIRNSSVPRPDLEARLRQLVDEVRARYRREAEALEAERGRGPRPQDLEQREDSGAQRVGQLVLIYFAAAVHVAFTHHATVPSTWRALDHLQGQIEERGDLVTRALALQTYVPLSRPWLTLRSPGATVLASASARVVTLAP